jgi:hypothetical protein
MTAEQVEQIEKYNLCFRERYVESSRSGELLNQDTFAYTGASRTVKPEHAAHLNRSKSHS